MRIRVVVSAGLAVLALAACGTERVRSGNPVGTLTMCTNVPYAPFEFDKNGAIVGFDVDLVGLVADELHQPLKVINVPFESIQDGTKLNDGTCDIAAAGLSITPERRRHLDFSIPYFAASQAVLVRKNNKARKLSDLPKGAKIGVQRGTTGLDYVRKRGFQPVEYDDALQQLIGLQAGHVEALVQDRPVIALWLTELKVAHDLKMIENLATGEKYGIAVRKGNTQLLRTVDQVLERSKKDGTFDSLYKRWFGTV